LLDNTLKPAPKRLRKTTIKEKMCSFNTGFTKAPHEHHYATSTPKIFISGHSIVNNAPKKKGFIRSYSSEPNGLIPKNFKCSGSD